MRREVGLLLLLAACAVVLAPAAAEPPLKRATLMPLWTPQAQFAGYYVALDKGMYARHGIDLVILPAGPGHAPAQSLEDGTADFVVLWLTTAIQHRSSGHRLVNLAQVIQTSSMMLVARKTSGIRTVADMNGRKVGLWGGDLSIPPRMLFARSGITVREVPQSHSVNLFLRGGIDVASAMLYNEYHTILDSGLDADELSVFPLHDHGMDFPEDGLYALQETIDGDPALADAFVRASLEGWRYAFTHTEETLDIVVRRMREAHLPANRVHQRWMLERMRELALPGGSAQALGLLEEQDYRAVAEALLRGGLIRDYPDFREFARRPDARQ
jgi:NitT/TauT family transport system substrate-binding protein